MCLVTSEHNGSVYLDLETTSSYDLGHMMYGFTGNFLVHLHYGKGVKEGSHAVLATF